jgi:hypothetical protein
VTDRWTSDATVQIGDSRDQWYLGGMGRYGLIGMLLCLGCTPSLESKTAGQVGCRPNDIAVSDISESPGLLQRSQTWVAECGGQRYICTELTTVGAQNDNPFGPADADVSCHPERGGQDSISERQARPANSLPPEPAKTQPETPDGEPPQGAAGFSFGSERSDDEAACSAAGHGWTKLAKRRYQCDGPVKSVGFDVSVALEYCDKQLCAIILVHRPEKDWFQSLEALGAALEDKYGEPSEDDTHLEFSCKRDERFENCLLHSSGHSRRVWEWTKGHLIELSAEKPTPKLDGESLPSLRMRYKKPNSVLEANSSAL